MYSFRMPAPPAQPAWHPSTLAVALTVLALTLLITVLSVSALRRRQLRPFAGRR